MFPFICVPCGKAGDITTGKRKKRRAMHAECRGGTWCDCQHVVK